MIRFKLGICTIEVFKIKMDLIILQKIKGLSKEDLV